MYKLGVSFLFLFSILLPVVLLSIFLSLPDPGFFSSLETKQNPEFIHFRNKTKPRVYTFSMRLENRDPKNPEGRMWYR